jgi:alpha-amylase/alpha-mannosidase (GH57 family)
MPVAQHALVLNLHQPAWNMEDLLANHEWEAKQILFALDRIPRSLWPYSDVGRVHLAMSGTLLESLSSPEFQKRVYGIVDCGSLLWYLQNQTIIDILGTGYYHPVLPLIPAADREEHVQRWLGIGRHLFARPRFNGFWPPEMAFSMELIPLLQKAGYRYVLVDSEYVEPVTPMRWEEIRYRPHIARYEGAQITVVVRDRELSDAQESGMEYQWFAAEVQERTKWCDFEPLVTTCTDGDNGGWFRNSAELANFWNAFYGTLCERARRADATLRPTFIHDYLDRHGAHGEVRVQTGAWNTGWHHGRDFLQWTGSLAQKHALDRVASFSESLHAVRERAAASASNPQAQRELEEALWRLLRAETSCNVYWGEAWVPRCEGDLDEAAAHLQRAESLLGGAS